MKNTTDKGELKGQEVTNKTLEELATEFRLISPLAFPEIHTIPLHGKLGHKTISGGLIPFAKNKEAERDKALISKS